MNKLMCAAVAAAISLLAGPIQAQPVTANVAFSSDYMLRGISQTLHKPAIQGGFDYASKMGIYAGLWSSNVNFGPADPTDQEVDTYAGYAAGLGPLGYDAGVIYYTYPGSYRDNYYEVYGKLSYQGLTASDNWTPNFFARTGTGNYALLSYTVPGKLPAGISVGAHVGHQWISNNAAWGTPDYTDYGVSVSRDLAGVTWKLEYDDSNLSKSECFGGSNLCEGTAVLSVSKSF